MQLNGPSQFCSLSLYMLSGTAESTACHHCDECYARPLEQRAKIGSAKNSHAWPRECRPSPSPERERNDGIARQEDVHQLGHNVGQTSTIRYWQLDLDVNSHD